MSVRKTKNLKISELHHARLKSYCDKNGLKLYRVVEKWIDQHCKERGKGLYSE